MDESLPAVTALWRAEADALGFTYGHSDTRHWSSRETTKAVEFPIKSVDFTSATHHTI